MSDDRTIEEILILLAEGPTLRMSRAGSTATQSLIAPVFAAELLVAA